MNETRDLIKWLKKHDESAESEPLMFIRKYDFERYVGKYIYLPPVKFKDDLIMLLGLLIPFVIVLLVCLIIFILSRI